MFFVVSEEYEFTQDVCQVLIRNPSVDVNLSLDGVEPLELSVQALHSPRHRCTYI